MKLWDDFSENFLEIDVRKEAGKERASCRRHKFYWDQVANWNVNRPLPTKRQVLGAKTLRIALETT